MYFLIKRETYKLVTNYDIMIRSLRMILNNKSIRLASCLSRHLKVRTKMRREKGGGGEPRFPTSSPPVFLICLGTDETDTKNRGVFCHVTHYELSSFRLKQVFRLGTSMLLPFNLVTHVNRREGERSHGS